MVQEAKLAVDVACKDRDEATALLLQTQQDKERVIMDNEDLQKEVAKLQAQKEHYKERQKR